MKKIQFTSKHLMIAATFLLAGLSFGFKISNSPDQITICHTPPGNPDNCHEITVSINALDAHLDHGDNLICHSADDFDAYNSILHAHLAKMPNMHTLIYKMY